MKNKKIAIIGSGIAGLALAYRILNEHPEYCVTIFEKDKKVGGLAVPFDIQGTRLEKFYHHIFKTDYDIIALIKELGLENKLKWHNDNKATMYKGVLYPFTTPVDLLKFPPLPFIDRVRLAVVTAFVTQIKDWKKLENKSADAWMKKYAGVKAYNILWKPLLYGKFESYYQRITMSWLWSRLVARLTSKGKLGYLEGSFGILFDTLEEKIEELGGNIMTSTEILSVEKSDEFVKIKYRNEIEGEKEEQFDKCILTTSPQIFNKFVKGFSDEYIKEITSIEYISAQTIVLTLSKKLTDYYWISVADLDEPALVVVEQSNMINAYNNKHVVYIGNYLNPNSNILGMNDEELEKVYYPFLKRLNKDFTPEWVEEFRVFRAPFAQPIVDSDYHNKIPEFASPLKNIYILTMSQVYPEDRGMNYAIKNAHKLYNLIKF